MKALNELTPEQLVLVVVNAVRAISDSALPEDMSDRLPAHMAARHRLCTTIAAAVRDIGYMGEMGYNQLLYPNERDTRRLISWLVSKLPRPEEDDAGGSGGGGAAGAARANLLRNLRAWVRDGVAAAHTPSPPAPGSPFAVTLAALDSATTRMAAGASASGKSGAAASSSGGMVAAALRAGAAFVRAANTGAPGMSADGDAGAAGSSGGSATHAALALAGLRVALAPSLQAATLQSTAGGVTGTAFDASAASATAVHAALAPVTIAADLDVLMLSDSQRYAATAKGATPGVHSAARAGVVFLPAPTPHPLQPTLRGWMSQTAPRVGLAHVYPGSYCEVYPSAFTRASAFAVPPPSAAGARGLGGFGAGATAAAGDVAKTEEEIAAEREAELAAMNARLEGLGDDIARLAEQFRLLTTTIPPLRAAVKDADAAKTAVERRYLVRKACLDMLPEAAANIGRLAGEVATRGDTLLALAAEWETHRAPLVAEINAALSAKTEQDAEAEALRSGIADVRGSMAALATEMAAKEELAAKLTAEWARTKELLEGGAAGAGAGADGTSTSASGELAMRPTYTRRIMEIVRQIRKQKAEIGRIVADVRLVQAEINVVADKLQRTVAVTSDIMERGAVENAKEPVFRQALSQLVRLQELFQQLVSATTTLGHMENEIRNLDNRCEQLAARNDARNMDALVADLAQVRSDNAALETAIVGAGAGVAAGMAHPLA